MWDKPRLLLMLSNLIYGLFAVVVLYTGVFLIVHSGWFPLTNIRVEGQLSHISREQIAYLADRLDGNFFTLNLDQTRTGFEKLPWVRSVNIRRRWPGTLVVKIEEHKALAHWGDSALVNTQGEVFEASSNDKSLPFFEGPEGSSQELVTAYGEFSGGLASLGLKPVRVELSARRAWRMQLNNGMQLVVGREQTLVRLARFVHIYQHAFAGRAQLQYVDLRYPNGLAIRLPPGVEMPEAGSAAGTKPIVKPVVKPTTKPINRPGTPPVTLQNTPAQTAPAATRSTV